MTASENPIVMPDFGASSQLALPEPDLSLPAPVSEVARWLGNVQEQLQWRLRTASSRITQYKREHPLRLLGVFMGTAFALGVVARVWSNHER